MHKILIFTISLFCNIVLSQNSKIRGRVIDIKTKNPLNSAHILNLNSVQGTITNEKGFFSITAKVSDTLLVSFLGYESIKLKASNDLLKGNELEISLNEKPQEVKEIVINSTKLIGILEIDVKMVPKDKFTRIKLNGLPQTYEIGSSYKNTPSLIGKIFNPIDGLYNLFGNKPRELKKIKKLKSEENLRKMLAGKFDREVIMEYLEMNKNQLIQLLKDCNYSEYFIKKASDLQLIEAILNCYENHKAIKKGAINRNRLPSEKLKSK